MPSDPVATALAREEAWKRAIYAFGTQYIFRQRYQSLRKKIRALTYTGLAVPLAVGAIVLGFGTAPAVLPLILGIAAALGVVQVLLFGWSVVAKWPDALAHALESMAANGQLHSRYRTLAAEGPDDLQQQMALLEPQYQAQQTADERESVTERERRKGMRAALRDLQKQCPTCKSIPVSMEPSSCNTCGNF